MGSRPAKFAERHPMVDLDFSLANQQANLIDEGFDVALRATADLVDSSLVARKLVDLEHHLHASPQYLQRRAAPATCEELTRHRCIVFRGQEMVRTWKLRGPGGAASSVRLRGRICGDDFTFVRWMVMAGAGTGLIPHINASNDEASGRLVRILPD
jgi:DNA-binding transcriptional LysR family regulator